MLVHLIFSRFHFTIPHFFNFFIFKNNLFFCSVDCKCIGISVFHMECVKLKNQCTSKWVENRNWLLMCVDKSDSRFLANLFGKCNKIVCLCVRIVAQKRNEMAERGKCVFSFKCYVIELKYIASFYHSFVSFLFLFFYYIEILQSSHSRQSFIRFSCNSLNFIPYFISFHFILFL